MATYVTLDSTTKLGCDICDRCCINRGDIKITPVNAIEISKYMNISVREFIEQYTTRADGEPLEIVIKAEGEKNRCVLNDKDTSKCKIHPVKPMQCVTFPLIPVDLENDIFYRQDTCDCAGQKEMPVLEWLNGEDGIYVKYKSIYMEWIRFIEDMQLIWEELKPSKQRKIFETLYYKYDGKCSNIEECVRKRMRKARKMIPSRLIINI